MCVLELVAVGPSHNEITMESETSWVSASKRVAVDIIVARYIKEELEEDRHDSSGVRFGAYTSVVVTDSGVSNVAVVVCAVEVNTVPTRGEVYLSSNGVALHGGESVTLLRSTVKDAHHADSPLSKVCVVLGTSCGVTSNHSETIREGQWYEVPVTVLSIGCIVASSLLVIHSG